MFHSAPVARSLAAVLVVAALAGCGKRDGIDVKTVTGRVTYNNEPLVGALVMFRPKDGSARVASGNTQADGRFVLLTSGAKRNGAMVGDYDVLIAKVIDVDDAGKPIVYNGGEYSPTAGHQKRPAQKSLIPEKYNVPDRPLLSVSVSKSSNTFTFNLTA